MIKHVVLWKLKSNNETVFETIRSTLQRQKIPGLLKTEIGRNFATGRRAVDFSLILDFESREALAAYHKHPAHMETRAIVDPLIADHWIVDYEV